ncbi:MAG: hypothetical protein U0744_07645 [Gemmataceae bacterium]
MMFLSRREMLQRMGTGLGMVGLAGLLQQDQARAGDNPMAPKQPHSAAGERPSMSS